MLIHVNLNWTISDAKRKLQYKKQVLDIKIMIISNTWNTILQSDISIWDVHYCETFRHSLVGAPIYLYQHYFLIVKIAYEFEIR